MKRSPVRLGDYFIQRFQSNVDFKSEALNICGGPLLLCYLDSLVDTAASVDIRHMIREITAPAESWKPIDALNARFVILHRTGNFVRQMPLSRKLPAFTIQSKKRFLRCPREELFHDQF